MHALMLQVKWGIDLSSEHERYLAERVFKSPVIVYNYPKDIKVGPPPATANAHCTTFFCMAMQRCQIQARHCLLCVIQTKSKLSSRSVS